MSMRQGELFTFLNSLKIQLIYLLLKICILPILVIVLSLSIKNKEQYLFEKYKDHYILKAIVKPDQSTILIGHEEGILNKIEFFNDKKTGLLY